MELNERGRLILACQILATQIRAGSCARRHCTPATMEERAAATFRSPHVRVCDRAVRESERQSGLARAVTRCSGSIGWLKVNLQPHRSYTNEQSAVLAICSSLNVASLNSHCAHNRSAFPMVASSAAAAANVCRQRSGAWCDEWLRHDRAEQHRPSSQSACTCVARRCAGRVAALRGLSELGLASRVVALAWRVAGGADSDRHSQSDQEQYRGSNMSARAPHSDTRHCDREAEHSRHRARGEKAPIVSVSRSKLPHEQPSD